MVQAFDRELKDFARMSSENEALQSQVVMLERQLVDQEQEYEAKINNLAQASVSKPSVEEITHLKRQIEQQDTLMQVTQHITSMAPMLTAGTGS